MDVEAAVSFEPVLNGLVFMCRVVIDNEVKIKVLSKGSVAKLTLFLRAQDDSVRSDGTQALEHGVKSAQLGFYVFEFLGRIVVVRQSCPDHERASLSSLVRAGRNTVRMRPEE